MTRLATSRPVIDAGEALALADECFVQRLRLVRSEDWDRPTPCTEWDVRALVNHVVGGAVRYEMLLHRAAPEEVEATRARDLLGADPAGAFMSAAARLTGAFREDGVGARTVDHRVGPRTGEQLLVMRVLDVAVHGWDLAVAIGADETIPTEVVDFLLELSPDLGHSRQLGTFAPPVVDSDGDASSQTRLLHLVGRKPDAARRAV